MTPTKKNPSTKLASLNKVDKWLKQPDPFETIRHALGLQYVEEAYHLLWIEHAPSRLQIVASLMDKNRHVGHFLETIQLRKNILGHVPTLLVGPPGVGKTTLVQQVAGDLGYRVIEVNAASNFNPLLLACGSRSLLGEKMMLLFDEADRPTEKFKKLVDSLKNKKGRWRVPIVFTAGSKTKQKWETIEINPLDEWTIGTMLVIRSMDEGSPEKFIGIAKKCNGDIRAAFVALEGYEIYKKDKIDPFVLAAQIRKVDPEQATELLDDSKPALAGFLRILAKRTSGTILEQMDDQQLLAACGRYKYVVDEYLIHVALSCLHRKR